MKTREEVLARVKYTEQRIQWAEEELSKDMQRMQKWLRESLDQGPEYIARWIGSYEREMNETKGKLEALRKELYLLQWVLYDDAVANTARVLRDGEEGK